MHVNEACVGRESEGSQDLIPLVRLVEVLDERFAIHCNTTCSSFDIYLSPGIFALAESPRLTSFVNLWLSNFLGQCASKIKQIDSVKLRKVIRSTSHIIEAVILCR